MKALDDLTAAERARVVTLFRSAIAARIEEWNLIAEMEGILLGSLDLDVSEWAANADDDDAADLTEDDVRCALQGKGLLR